MQSKDTKRIEDTCNILRIEREQSRLEHRAKMKLLTDRAQKQGCVHVRVNPCDAELCALLQATADLAVGERAAGMIKAALRKLTDEAAALPERRRAHEG